MNLLHTLGLMTRKEHEADCDLCKNTRVVQDAVDSQSYPETAPCPKCRDGYWALKAARDWHAKFKRAATDLAAQAEEIAELHGWKSTALIYADEIAEMKKRVANADDRASRFEKLNVALFDEANALRPDAEAMRKKRAADRKRMAGKRGKA